MSKESESYAVEKLAIMAERYGRQYARQAHEYASRTNGTNTAPYAPLTAAMMSNWMREEIGNGSQQENFRKVRAAWALQPYLPIALEAVKRRDAR